MTIKEIIKKYQLAANKKLGQNFLLDNNIAIKICNSCLIDRNTTVIEIGPGLGSLTRVLLTKAKRVLAFEIDKVLADILQTEMPDDKLQVINQDFLKVNLGEYLRNDDNKLVVCANLPYYITTAILFKLFEDPLAIEEILVMMQKEVAERFGAKVGTKQYGSLSLLAQFRYRVDIIMKVKRQAFYPVPNVDSTVVAFRRKTPEGNIDGELLFGLIKSCFQYRRKTIYNNYRQRVGETVAKKNLAAAGIAANNRAEQLTLTDFLRLYQAENEEKMSR